MGIIGVVAALTIPNVNKNTSNMEKVTRFKKIYAELNEALDRATAVYGPVKTWYNNINFDDCLDSADGSYICSKKFMDRLTEFMKVTKSCRGGDEDCPCNYSDYTSCIVFANGASIEVDYDSEFILLDIDGQDKDL